MSSVKQKKSANLRKIPVGALIFPLGVLIVILVSLALLLKPQVEGISENREIIQANELILKKLTEKLETLENQSEDELKSYLVSVNRVLPEKKPVFKLVNALAGLSQEVPEVVISDYSINPGSLASASAETNEIPGEISAMTTEMDVSGSYEGIMTYLTKLRQMAPLIGITSISVNGELNPLSNETQSVDVSMMLDVYYSLSPDTLGKIRDPLPEYQGDFSETQARLDEFQTFQTGEFQFIEVDQQRENPFSF